MKWLEGSIFSCIRWAYVPKHGYLRDYKSLEQLWFEEGRVSSVDRCRQEKPSPSIHRSAEMKRKLGLSPIKEAVIGLQGEPRLPTRESREKGGSVNG
jgi:hypothetical protein